MATTKANQETARATIAGWKDPLTFSLVDLSCCYFHIGFISYSFWHFKNSALFVLMKNCKESFILILSFSAYKAKVIGKPCCGYIAIRMSWSKNFYSFSGGIE